MLANRGEASRVRSARTRERALGVNQGESPPGWRDSRAVTRSCPVIPPD
jgi:hypothetical protein